MLCLTSTHHWIFFSEWEREDYRLLCTDGAQANLSEFRTCNLGRGPGGGVVTRINFRKTARKFLQAAQMVFGRQGRDKQHFQLFESQSYGGRDLLFRDKTEKLAVFSDSDISQVLGLDYVALLKGLGHEGSSLEDSVIRWCCISDAEQKKCEEWALSIKSDPLVCVRASSMSNCIEKIKRDEVDAVSLDGTHAFIAGKCGLVPVVAEYYVFPSVFAVAVVRRSSRNVFFGNLAGRRSCHGHMYSPAGWLMPARHNLSSQHNSSTHCDPSKVYSEVFWKGCLPGSQGSLCKVCIGGTAEPGTKRCTDNHNERYYGNMGALRCLVGDPSGKTYGDVAFLEQHNLEDNIKSLGSSGWAEGWLAWDFELLCPDGRRASLSQWESCHLGAIPPNLIMTRPILTARVYDFLMKSQETLAAHPDEFNLFESQKYGESDLLFKDVTRCFVHTSHLDYHTILGEDFYRTMETIFNCTRSAWIRRNRPFLKMLLSWRAIAWLQDTKKLRYFTSASTLDFVPTSAPIGSLVLEQLQDFVYQTKRLFVITGAGISTESGIPDYRSEGVGLYFRTERRPIQHAEFLRSSKARQRYWARNYVGWPQFSSHQPNLAHLALRSWEAVGKVHWLVTQNVDALHSKAGQQNLTELHGCTHRVVCLGCGSRSAREALQARFTALNPGWVVKAGGVAPDGDVFLSDEQVQHFRVPSCESCGGILKPEVTFFGDTVNRETVNLVQQKLVESDGVLVVGSSLQVYSGYRFLLTASERKIPVAILNIGPTRADHLSSIRVSARCGDVLPAILPLTERELAQP
ncbi:hypothetical protein COCON_G00155910 [Conger conger]|uniref:NAD-dependent protein deacylase n=1 Tax=Conger conger TaxID=82655 RepID=A0A9Q1D9Z7_CONCO|nr:hypothetical protein COCON_G00155910 [Conger conger]